MRKLFDLSEIRKFSAAVIALAAAVFLSVQTGAACSSDHLIWQVREKNADPLYRFIKDGKAGYIDRTGKIVIAPTLETYGNYGEEFSGGVLLKKFSGTYIDMTGKVVLDTNFSSNWDFSDGLAAAIKEGENKWGYIDKTGKFVISPRFETFPNGYVYSFSDGRAMIDVKKKFGYIDHTGEFVIQPKFLEGAAFREGFARVVVEGPCVYVGEGACALFNARTVGGDDVEGEKTPMCKFAFIDKSGAFISNQRFVRAADFSEGLAAVMVEGNWNPFGESDGKWGFIDTSGKIVINPQFNNAASFSDGLAAVTIGGKWGFINKQGEIVIKPQFDTVESFSDGLAPVGVWNEKERKYANYYYIDKKGKPAFPGKFAEASHYFKGVAHVKLIEPNRKYDSYHDGKYAYLDATGRKIFAYERISKDD